jgi:hypothetical protein
MNPGTVLADGKLSVPMGGIYSEWTCYNCGDISNKTVLRLMWPGAEHRGGVSVVGVELGCQHTMIIKFRRLLFMN